MFSNNTDCVDVKDYLVILWHDIIMFAGNADNIMLFNTRECAQMVLLET